MEMIAVGKMFMYHSFTLHKLATSKSSLPICILNGQGEQETTRRHNTCHREFRVSGRLTIYKRGREREAFTISTYKLLKTICSSINFKLRYQIISAFSDSQLLDNILEIKYCIQRLQLLDSFEKQEEYNHFVQTGFAGKHGCMTKIVK